MGPNALEYKIGEIFSEIKNKIHSGYKLREIIDHIDALRFRSQSEKPGRSHLYDVLRRPSWMKLPLWTPRAEVLANIKASP